MEDLLDLNNTLSNNIDNNLTQTQNSFLESKLGSVIDKAIDIGIKALLPDVVENQVIDIKNTIMQDGIRAGIQEAISGSLELGKSVIGIFTGNFENISQIQNAIKKGGLIDSVSSIIDKGISVAVDKNIIDKSVGKVIKAGKNEILNNVSNSVENSISDQMSQLEKLNKNCDKWQIAFDSKDFPEMQKAYNKISKQIEKIVPLETTINKAREIENLHNLIKNNGMNFDLSTEQLELAKII